MSSSSSRYAAAYYLDMPATDYGVQRLGKNPEDYPDAKSQPHVQVALRMKARGITARAGDVIPYVFCLGESGESSKTAQADKAKHPDEVRRESDKLKIGEHDVHVNV